MKAKKAEFLKIAGLLNEKLHVTPLLYGSLGLEQRLDTDLDADDIDVLIPEAFLHERWGEAEALMNAAGYVLNDPEEHSFEKGSVTVAFASLESLTPFAGVEIAAIPRVEEAGVRYLLLDLPDYLKVYAASSKDGYRRDVRNKKDGAKLRLIKAALGI